MPARQLQINTERDPILPAEIRAKLAGILRKKSDRAGEFCLSFDPLLFPLKLRESFPQFERIVLEIGCGWGEFTRAYAKLNPKTLVVALEKKLARVLICTKAQRAESIPNIRYMVLDLAWFFSGIFAADQFDGVMINFPDPWPKTRHHKHRFISAPLTNELARISRGGCRLIFATDDYIYAREAASVFENSDRWINTQGSYMARSDIPSRPVSFFEQLHRNEGALIYFLEYEVQRSTP